MLADRVAAAETRMDAGQHVVLVAVDQRDPMLDRGFQRGAQIVGVDDRRQVAEALRQRDRLVPGQQLALLDVDVRVREFGDRPHVIEMRVRDEDVGDRARRDAESRPASSAARSSSGCRISARSRLCSSCMKPVSISTLRSPRRARMKEKGRSIDAVVIHAADQVDPGLVPWSVRTRSHRRPSAVCSHVPPLSFQRASGRGSPARPRR